MRPDHLVLGVGGIAGEAWTSGLLAGIEDVTGTDLRECASFTGTSAGAIVSAALQSGMRPRRPERIAEPEEEERTEEAYADQAAGAQPDLAGAEATLRAVAGALLERLGPLAGPLSGLAPLALGGSATAGAALRRLALSQLPRGRRSLLGFRDALEDLGASFDGRLRIVAVEQTSGRRVVFGAEDAPEAAVSDAVLASCAVPTVFEPVTIGDREYVDGGAWSPTNLDVAPVERDQHVLLTNPTAFLPGGWGQLVRALTGVEVAAARSRGVHVVVVQPDSIAAREIGPNLMSRTRVDAAVATGHRQGRALASSLAR